MESEIIQWAKRMKGDLSEIAIRSNFSKDRYRVSSFSYPKDTIFPAIMYPGTCFVLNGQCNYSFESFEITLCRGEFVDLPGGDYILKVMGDDKLELVLVWELPNQLERAPSED